MFLEPSANIKWPMTLISTGEHPRATLGLGEAAQRHRGSTTHRSKNFGILLKKFNFLSKILEFLERWVVDPRWRCAASPSPRVALGCSPVDMSAIDHLKLDVIPGAHPSRSF